MRPLRRVDRNRFQFGCRIDSDWAAASNYEITAPNASGRVLVDGTNIEIDAPHRLVQTFHAHWDDATTMNTITDRLAQQGVTVHELLRWPGVPPMFKFNDPDGNIYTIIETS